MPLAYDGTGTRITSAGCGINGQTIGAAGGSQTAALGTSNLPPYTPEGTITNGAITAGGNPVYGGTDTRIVQNSAWGVYAPNNTSSNSLLSQASSTFAGTAQGGTSTPFSVVQPSIVTGIWVVATGL